MESAMANLVESIDGGEIDEADIDEDVAKAYAANTGFWG